MSGFTFFKRGECPVCNGVSRKDCRKSNDTQLIFCRDNSADPTNYVYRGEDVHGFGLWQATVDAEEFGQQAALERERRRCEFLEGQERRRQQRIAQQLPVQERDQWYRKLLDQLILKDADRQKLLDRGFTPEQIQRDGYRSVEKWQEVHCSFPYNLPGILRQGFGNTTLNIPGDGILCPIPNKDGLIVGCQIRLHDGIEGRYRWLTSCTKKSPNGATSHLGGELPLGVFEPDSYLHASIWLCEGTGIKPSITCGKMGVPVVGAAGGRFDSSPETAKAAIEYLSAKYQTKILTFAVDAGDVVNTSGVPKRWSQQFEFFEKLGYQCRVAWWGQVTKDAKDIDELDDLSVIEFITPDEFLKLVVSKPTPIADNSQFEAWLRKRKFTAHREVSQNQFSFGDIPQSGVVIAGKSGLGTGKTEGLIEITKEDTKRGRGSVIIGYRNNLLLQTGCRALSVGVEMYHIHMDDNAKLMIGDSNSNHMMCLDSIHHLDGYFKGKTIYLDEVCSVLSHAIGGGTLGDSQAKTLKIFKQALIECDRVVILDGNLADVHANFIARIADKQLIKVENIKKIASHKITIIDGVNADGEIKKRDKSPLINFMMSPGVRPWIFADSKEFSKVLYKLLTDLGLKGYLLNSETTSENWAKEFLENPDAFIEKYKPDFFAGTPTMDSGISVQIRNYFTHKFSFFCGVLSTNSQHQAMFRLRDNTIPHYVFCPEFSTIRDNSQPNHYSAQKIAEALNDRVTQSALLAGCSADNPGFAKQVMMEALQRIDSDWFDLSAELLAIENYEKDNYRRCLIHVLEEAGHEVEVVQWDVVSSVKESQKLAREEILAQEAKEIYAAVELKSIEEANQKAKASPNKEMQRRIQKTRLLDRLPGIENSEVWGTEFILNCHLNKRQFITQQQRYWLLKNYDISQKRHESAWNYAALGEDLFSRQVSAMGHDVIWALHELELLKFTESNHEFHKDSESVIELVSKLRSRRDIQIALRMTSVEPEKVGGGERMRILSHLLDLVGYKTQFTQQLRIETDAGVIRTRHYVIVPTVEPKSRHTPPSNINKPEECVPDSERNNQGSTYFDFVAAREAILTSIDFKYTSWMDSDKSKVKWEVEEPQTLVQDSQTLLTTETTSRHTPVLYIYKSGEYVPEDNSSSTVLDTSEVQDSACLLQECINDPKVGGYETILALTERWTEKFKAAVWNLLSAVERQLLWRMKYSL